MTNLTQVTLSPGVEARVREHATFLMGVEPGCIMCFSTGSREAGRKFLDSGFPHQWATWVEENGSGLYGMVPTVESFEVIHLILWFEHANDAVMFKLNFFG